MAGLSSDPSDYLGQLVGSPVTITSGFRTPQKNALVGGVSNSAHLVPGQAFDFVPKGISTSEAANRIAKSGIPFDQVYDEGNHVHVSFAPTNRRQVIQPKMAQAQNVSDEDLLGALGGSQASSSNPPAGKDVSDADLLGALGGSQQTVSGGFPAASPSSPTGQLSQAPPTYMGMPFGFTEEVGSHIPFAKDVAAGVPALLDTTADFLTGNGPSLSDLVSGNKKTLSSRYHQNLSDFNTAQQAYEAQNPGLSTLGAGIGIVASGKPSAGAVSSGIQTFGQLIKAGAKGGATLGGLIGLGSPEGSDQGIGGRLENAGIGAATGAATGAALPVAGAIVRPVGKAVGATLGAILQKAGITGADYGDQAANKLIQALNRDQISAKDVADALTNAPANKPITAMDVAGTNTKRVARNLVTNPGQAGDQVTSFLENRSDDQAGRVLSDIGQHLSSNTDVYGVADNLVKQRSQDSAPLWKAAMERPPVTTDRLEQFSQDSDVQAGMKEGIKLARREALAKGEKFDPNAYAVTGFNSAGDPEIGPVPTWRTWQAAKEGLDEKIESFRDPVTRQLPNTKNVNSLVGLKNSLLKELDSVNPDYAAARAAWGGPSQSNTAMNMGNNFLKADPEEIVQAFSKLSDSDKDFYRIGAARAIQDKANSASDSADLSKRLFGNARVRAQIESVFGKGSADNFGQAMGQESTMANTKRFVLGNSTTANKLADAEDSHQQVAQDILHGGLSGGPKGAIIAPAVNAVRRGINNLFSGIHPEVANKLAEALTASGQAGAQTFQKLGAKQAASIASTARKQGFGQLTNRLLSGAAAYNATNQQ